MSKFLVVEGFGDFTEGLDTCEAVKVVKQFESEAKAVRFAASHYESSIWGEDADGFSLTPDARMAFFTLVRTAEEMAK
jgi:hypothetical protein